MAAAAMRILRRNIVSAPTSSSRGSHRLAAPPANPFGGPVDRDPFAAATAMPRRSSARSTLQLSLAAPGRPGDALRPAARGGRRAQKKTNAAYLVRSTGVEVTFWPMSTDVTGHAGELAVAVAQAHGVETMFMLSGAHVFPLYDGAVTGRPPRPSGSSMYATTSSCRLRRRGHRQADRGAGQPGRGPSIVVLGRDQRAERRRPGAVRRLADGGGRRPGAAGALGHRERSRSSTSRRSSRRSRSSPRTIPDRGRRARGHAPGVRGRRRALPTAWPGVRRRAHGRAVQLLRPAPTGSGERHAHRARRRRDRRRSRGCWPRPGARC